MVESGKLSWRVAERAARAASGFADFWGGVGVGVDGGNGEQGMRGDCPRA